MTVALAFLLSLPVPLPEVSPDDLSRFPGFSYAEWADGRAGEYRDAVIASVEGLGFACQREAEWDRIARVCRVAEAWHHLEWAWRDSQYSDYGTLTWHLGELRSLIGPAAYYAGRMPPPLPPPVRRID